MSTAPTATQVPPRLRESPPGVGPEGPRSGGPSVWPLISFLRRLREGLESGKGLPPAIGDAVASLPRDVREGVDLMARRLAGDYPEDAWGFDEQFADAAYPLLDFVYQRWWRVQVEGAVNVPSHERALLVSNHAGTLPLDAFMIGMAILKEHPLPRYARFLALNWAFELPFVSVAIRKLGGVPASPHNALRLLEEDQLVGVFPEGVKGTRKPFAERYRLQRFGRGGFVELALRTGSPIVPVAVVGSEEIYPKLGESQLLARLTGAPFVPLTPTFPWLGPLGAMPLPSKWRIEFCEPIDVSGLDPRQADNRPLVFEISERVRSTIQSKLYEQLVKRGNAFV